MNKVIYLTIIGITLLFSSCKNREVREQKIGDKLVEQFYVVETDDGSFVRDGEYKTWFPSGQIERNGQYQDGNRIGEWKGWYKNGQMEFVYNFKNDTLEGSFIRWYSNGQKRIEGIKINNFPWDEIGIWSSWYENGQILSKENHNNEGKLDKIQIYWHSNGTKSKEANYLDGLKEGPYQCWNNSGNLYFDRTFKEDSDTNLPVTYKSAKGYKLELNPDGTFTYKYLKDVGNYWRSKWVWKTREGTYTYTDDKFELYKFYTYKLKKFTADTLMLDNRTFIRVKEEEELSDKKS